MLMTRTPPAELSQSGQENKLGALGLMLNLIVLWQTVYIQVALDQAAHQQQW